MSFNRVQVQPEISGPDAPEPTVTGKPSALEAQKPAPEQQQQTQEQQQQERPVWLPEKFKSAEDMAKAYAELEKKQGQPKAEEKPEEKSEEQPKEGEDKPEEKTEDKKEETPESKPEFKEFFEEFESKGEISEESYAKLEKMGLPRTMVDAYKAGVLAQRAQAEEAIYSAVGGKDNWPVVSEWAVKNLSKGEVDGLNKILDSGDVGQMQLAMSGLYSKYQNAEGKPSKFVHGSPSGNGVRPFGSMQEVTAAMNDPRYKSGDPAYHAEIDARLAVSNAI